MGANLVSLVLGNTHVYGQKYVNPKMDYQSTSLQTPQH